MAAAGGQDAMVSALDPFSLLKDEKPAPPPAEIRPFDPKTDTKLVRYIVGAGVMEPSSIANLYTLWTPFFVLLWAVAAHFLVQRFAGGYPIFFRTLVAGEGFAAAYAANSWQKAVLEFFTIAPAVCAPPIILLALFELRHRNMFEDEMTRAIGEEDMINTDRYYGCQELRKEGSSDTASAGGRKGFWVLEYDSRVIGAIGIDGFKPGQNLDSVVDALPTASATPSSTKAAVTSTTESTRALRSRKSAATLDSPKAAASSSSETLYIRRFATSLSFRPADIENDLLNHAADFAFEAKRDGVSQTPASRLTISVRPGVERNLTRRLKSLGFKELPSSSPDVVNKDAWKTTELAKSQAGRFAPVSKVLDSVWPLDLSWRTYALDRATWEARK